MWHLYYKDGEIRSLSKKKQSIDLPYLRVSDDVGEKFANLEYRYIDWQVIKRQGRYQLTKREDVRTPVYHNNFYQVPPGDHADIVVTRRQNIVSCDYPIRLWVTRWNDPLTLIGTVCANELLVPMDCKISIFTKKPKETIVYDDQDFPC